MVNDRLHIICGNCGQDLKEPNMATWEYVPAIHDEETGEVIQNADVFIRCDNCATIHFLKKYMKEKRIITMTDKQIIINGVDVNECAFIGEHTACLANCTILCKSFPNCYYKQLKAKEQECEELKSRLNCRCFDPSINNNRCISYNRIAEDYERDLKQLDQLKAENEQLKSVRDSWMSKYEQETKIRELYQDGLDQLKAENEELKKKIKYMEEYIKTVENSRNEFEKESKFLKEENAEIRKHNILQKISEVLND